VTHLNGKKETWHEADEVIAAIKEHDSFLITSHISIDGDAISSELALSKVLEKLGKKSWIVNESRVPHILDFLPGLDRMKQWPEMPSEKWDAVFILDLGKWTRMGRVQEAISKDSEFIIDIDHHRSTTGCGTVSLIDSTMSSTGELLYEFFRYAGFQIDADIALLLYVAVVTDTGRFSFDNTTVRTHRNVAELMECGVDTQYVTNMIYRRQKLAQFRLFERALSSLSVNRSGEIAWIVLRKKDFEETGTSALMTQEFIETPRSIEGIKLGIFFREMDEPGKVKVSMRSNIGFDLNNFSAPYGGGGHAAAAGISLKASIEEAIDTIIPALETALAGL